MLNLVIARMLTAGDAPHYCFGCPFARVRLRDASTDNGASPAVPQCKPRFIEQYGCVDAHRAKQR
jgi:hypothetical protein